MQTGVTCLVLLYTTAAFHCATGQAKCNKRSRALWYKARSEHEGLGLSDAELQTISRMGDMKHLKNVLNPILMPRVVGTESHTRVRKHLVDTMSGLGWTVEEDSFDGNTPLGMKRFTNVIATLDPDAPRHLVLACHYDSKIDRENVFVGATDSAVPCAMMMNLAKVMQAALDKFQQTCLRRMTRRVNKRKEKKLMALTGKRKPGCIKKKFKEIWKKLKAKYRPKAGGNQDYFLETSSIHRDTGERTGQVRRQEQRQGQNFLEITTMPRKSLRCFGRVKCCSGNGNENKFEFVPRVQSDLTLQFIFFDGEEAFHRWSKTDSLYGARDLAAKLQDTSYPANNRDGTNKLHRMDLFVLLDLLGSEDVQIFNYFRDTESWYARLVSYEQRLNDLQLLHRRPFIFKKRSMYNAGIEDDHIPFLERGVPVLHLIPAPFPSVWHKNTDNASALHYPTIENFTKILQAFVADYLHLVF